MITDKKYIERIFDSLNDKDAKEYLKKEKEIIDIKEKSKVVFLDIDGVLNNMNYLTSVQKDIEEAMCEEKKWSSFQIDPEKVELLNRIIKKNKCCGYCVKCLENGPLKTRTSRNFGYARIQRKSCRGDSLFKW